MLRRHGFKLIIVGGIVLALVGFATRADAARSWASVPPVYAPKAAVQRIGLNCQNTEYLVWGVRYCVTVRARKDRLGRWWFQPAAVVAGYNAQGRRSMRLVAAVRMGGRTTTAAAKARRLVVRGRWRVGANQADDAKAVFVIRFPNGKKSALKLTPYS